jgi:hypothetical protein
MVTHFKECSYMLCNVPTSYKSDSLCHCQPYGQGVVLCWGKQITKGKASSTYVRKMLSLLVLCLKSLGKACIFNVG